MSGGEDQRFTGLKAIAEMLVVAVALVGLVINSLLTYRGQNRSTPQPDLFVHPSSQMRPLTFGVETIEVEFEGSLENVGDAAVHGCWPVLNVWDVSQKVQLMRDQTLEHNTWTLKPGETHVSKDRLVLPRTSLKPRAAVVVDVRFQCRGGKIVTDPVTFTVSAVNGTVTKVKSPR